ncbi:hypothetical protein CRG98_020724 [Punica granatum]|uniref:Retrotransposon gag domain-containing protein n=1 Tax=Punica granatum TaxID=22663 RepID=A0A2I0JRG3_PUNGR|nr:hypothetical protein CRG98_020724 [Punica granatum]
MADDDINRQIQGVARALRDYAVPTVMGFAIRRLTIPANNFELKPALIQIVQLNQFGGYLNESPDEHIAGFLQYCNMVKLNKVTDDVIRLQLFPFSLRDKARAWFNSLPQESITTWTDLSSKFLRRFFLPAKTARLRNEITNFTKFNGESLNEAWERFKEAIRKCPYHRLPDNLLIEVFYLSMDETLRSLVDAAAGGALMVDFIVLEMEEDKNVPMILGRPFLATDAIKKFGDDKSCYTINIIDELIFESVEEKACVDTMESVLRDLDDWSDDDEPEEEYVENVLEIKARYYEELGTSATKPVPYLTQPPVIELKPLPRH